jgi:hypothetical protein
MLKSPLDDKILHLKEMGFIEEILFKEVLAPDDFYKELIQHLKNNKIGEGEFLSTKELEKVDDFIKVYFASKIEEAKVWLLRAYIVGRLLAKTDLAGTAFDLTAINSLPGNIKDAAKQYALSIEETMALKAAVEEGAALLSNASIDTIQTVRDTLTENIKRGADSKTLYERLREVILTKNVEGKEDPGELNRDWQRVAITESNSVFNNGYLSLMREGDYVVGFSMPDACENCVDLISGKVYKVRKEAAPDYSGMSGDEYEKWATVWENYVWVGKNNYGRSSSKQKRIDKNVGNKKENLREKHHHEHNMPACPNHPNCRCRWVRINVMYQWVDKNGQIKLRVEDEDAWEKWHDEEILQRFGTGS